MEPIDELLAFLNSIAEAEGWPLSAACLAQLRKITKEIKVKEGDILLSPGEVCKNLYFIRTGLMKCSYLVHGREVTDWVFGELQTVVSVDSFYDQVRGVDFIRALEDCVLFYISYKELDELYKKFVEFNVVGRVFTIKYLRIWHRQARNIRMLTAEERYQFLLDTQPELINRVSVQDLASLLDMSRETLSRMRGRIH